MCLLSGSVPSAMTMEHAASVTPAVVSAQQGDGHEHVAQSSAAAAPSPQSVGREFVRQYYTLLNQAPLHLHRFYSNNSSFVHGGCGQDNSSEPVSRFTTVPCLLCSFTPLLEANR
jgi:hypothetical protein